MDISLPASGDTAQIFGFIAGFSVFGLIIGFILKAAIDKYSQTLSENEKLKADMIHTQLATMAKDFEAAVKRVEGLFKDSIKQIHELKTRIQELDRAVKKPQEFRG